MNSKSDVPLRERASVQDEIKGEVIRGKDSWNFIYIALGFVLSIEGTLVQMLTPVVFPYNILFYVIVGAITFSLFIFNGSLQNWLFGTKKAYENRPH